MIFLSLVLMLVSLFVSRAGLSIGMMLFCGASFLHRSWKAQWILFYRHPFLVGITLLFLIPFLSGLWSEDKEEWSDLIRIKLPLLLMPLAFSGPWQLSENQWRLLGYSFITVCLLGSLWSTVLYLQNPAEIHEGYLKAKLFRTPLQNDHIRFSWMVTVGIMTAFLLLESGTTKRIRALLFIGMVWMAVYLHILSARTGLISFYIFLLAYLVRMIFRQGKKGGWVVILAGIIILPVLAWHFLPTFQNRIRYILYDYEQATSRLYQPASNDGNRMLSLKAGWSILREHPFGVGTGDVLNETYRWYDRNVPGMLETDRLYPSSEWIIYAASAGWPGLLFFTLIMLLPIFHEPEKYRFYWLLLNAIAAASFIFDIGLEVQFGVFLYLFTVLWWWKWLNPNLSPV